MSKPRDSKTASATNGWIRSAIWGLLVVLGITMIGWLRVDIRELRKEVRGLSVVVATMQADVKWLKDNGVRR